MTAAGRFITIEGGEGVGKSTNLEHLRTLLRQRQIDFVRDPRAGRDAAGRGAATTATGSA